MDSAELQATQCTKCTGEKRIIVRTVPILRLRMLKPHFYRIKAHAQGKAGRGELESCIPGMRCAVSAEQESLETIQIVTTSIQKSKQKTT